jgi:hypothetical protein
MLNPEFKFSDSFVKTSMNFNKDFLFGWRTRFFQVPVMPEWRRSTLMGKTD